MLNVVRDCKKWVLVLNLFQDFLKEKVMSKAQSDGVWANLGPGVSDSG